MAKNPSAYPQGLPKSDGEGYEHSDANVKWVLTLVMLLLTGGVIIHFALAGMMRGLRNVHTTFGSRQTTNPPSRLDLDRGSIPRLQSTPSLDFEAFREREQKELDSYGWIDQTAGVVRIPIESAMDLILQKGLLSNAGNSFPTGPSSFELQEQRTRRKTAVHESP